MADVYRRPNSPYWYFDVMVGGKRKRHSTRRTLKAEAVVVAATELKKALDAEQLGVIPELTLREALFDHYLPSRKGKASYDELERHCHTLCGDRKGIKGLGGDTKMHEIVSTKLSAYRAARRTAGMSEASINLEVRCVSGAYNMVKEDYRVRQGLRFPIVTVKGKPRPLTPDEELALLADLDPERGWSQKGRAYQIRPLALVKRQRVDNYDLAVMLLDTGARFNEIASLTWGMIDTDEFGSFRLIRTKVNNESILVTTDRMQAVLRRRWSERSNSRFVFQGWTEGGKDEHRESTAAIRRAMARIGINTPENVARYGRRDVRSLRDTFASKLRRGSAAKGVQPMALDRLQKLLGHASMQMTMKYADLAVDQASTEAVAALNLLNQ